MTLARVRVKDGFLSLEVLKKKKRKEVVSTSIFDDGLLGVAGGLDGRLYVFGNSSEPLTVIQVSFPGLSTSISPDGMRILAGGGPRVGYYQIVASKTTENGVTPNASDGPNPTVYVVGPAVIIAAFGLSLTVWLRRKRSHNSVVPRNVIFLALSAR